MTAQLVRYEQARTALAEAHRVDEVKDIRDKAEAMAAYARQAKDQDLILWATEIKVRAERKAGEMLRDAKANGELATPADGVRLGANKHLSDSTTSAPQTLSQLGVTKDQSQRWQSLASMSDEHFETAVATAKDTAGQVTTAFMLREAARAKPQPVKGKKAEAIREELKAAKDRGVSMLASYARLTLRAIEFQDSVTDEEMSLLVELADAIAALSAERAKP